MGYRDRQLEDHMANRRDPIPPQRGVHGKTRCPTPDQLDRILNDSNDSKIKPNMAASKTAQRNQFAEDRHAPGYDNDVPLKGERSWLRGAGRGGEDRPTFDRGKLDASSKPPKPASGLKATGLDCHRSPFSKAHSTYGED
jgi:hypothetical protein